MREVREKVVKLRSDEGRNIIYSHGNCVCFSEREERRLTLRLELETKRSLYHATKQESSNLGTRLEPGGAWSTTTQVPAISNSKLRNKILCFTWYPNV